MHQYMCVEAFCVMHDVMHGVTQQAGSKLLPPSDRYRICCLEIWPSPRESKRAHGQYSVEIGFSNTDGAVMGRGAVLGKPHARLSAVPRGCMMLLYAAGTRECCWPA